MHLLLDFAQPASVAGWAAVDDRVMGGVSRSRLRHDASGWAVFEGDVSLAQGGGFASVRSAPRDWGRPQASALCLQVAGSPQRYKFSLYQDDELSSIAWQAGFVPAAEHDWSTVRLPLASFQPQFRGRPVIGAPPLDPARIRQLGLTIADRQAGPFALRLLSLALELQEA